MKTIVAAEHKLDSLRRSHCYFVKPNLKLDTRLTQYVLAEKCVVEGTIIVEKWFTTTESEWEWEFKMSPYINCSKYKVDIKLDVRY